jgi:hypothetical protein
MGGHVLTLDNVDALFAKNSVTGEWALGSQARRSSAFPCWANVRPHTELGPDFDQALPLATQCSTGAPGP